MKTVASRHLPFRSSCEWRVRIVWAVVAIALGADVASAQDARDATGGAEPTPPAAAPEPPAGTIEPGPLAPGPAIEEPKPLRAEPEPPAAIISSLQIRGFRFSGNELIPSAELQALLQRYVGGQLDLELLREAASAVTAEYHRRGMDLSRAYLPAQVVEEGVVEIQVVEGRLGRVVVEGNTNYSSELIQEHIAAAAAEPPLRSAELETALLILNELRDLEVSAALEPGVEPGTVDVRVRVEDGFPLRPTLFFNNFGSEFVSRHRLGLQLDWSNALISGASLTLTGLIGEDPERLAFGSFTYLLPLNALGTKLGATGSYGAFEVGEEFSDLGVEGEQASIGVFVSHPFVRTRTLSFAAEAGFGLRNAKYFLLDEVSSHDEIRTFYVTFQSSHDFWSGRLFASLNITQGLGQVLDGLSREDPSASRLDADNVFTRVSLQLARIQSIHEMLAVYARFGGQWSSDSLVASEEWQTGGADGVRGYGPGEAAGDHGYVANLELRVSPLEDRRILTFLLFADHGAAYRKRTVIGQEDARRLTGAGIGVRSHFEYFVTVDLRFELGWPIDPNENLLNEDPVIYASASIRY